MTMQLGHVHIKTREDPRKVAQFYIDNFGATVKQEIPGPTARRQRTAGRSVSGSLRVCGCAEDCMSPARVRGAM